MTRQLFLEIVNHELYGTLFIIILSFLLCWWSQFRLSYLLLGVKVNTRQMVPALFVMVTFSFFSKQFIHLALGAIIAPFIMALFLWVTTKGIHYLKACWVAFITILISNVGAVIITFLFCAVFPSVNFFLLHTPFGLAAGTWLETLGPVLVLFILPKLLPRFKTPLIPPIKAKPDRVDFTAISTSFSMYIMNYITAFIVYISLIKEYHFIFLALVALWCVAVFTVVGHYRLVKSLTQEFEKEKSELIAEKVRLEEEKRQIEVDRNRVAAEKARLEMEKERIEKEKNQLQIDKTNLLEEKDQLEEEKIGLINKIQELSNQDGFKSPKLNQIVKDFVFRVLNLEQSGEDHSNDPLTDRELSVLALVKDGMDNKEIAAALDLDPGTIKNITYGLFKKLNVKNRTQLALYASNLFNQNKK